jgi:signal transduction histidine kinase
MWPKPNLTRLLVRIPLVMAAVIFISESAIMVVFALTASEGHNRWMEVVVDSTVLTLTVAPLTYALIVRPLRALADERSRLLAHVFEIQDDERRQIARDLHDEIGQAFTSLLVHSRVLEDAESLEEARSQARELRRVGGEVYDQIRSLARGLHPTVLDDLGLLEAVRRLTEDFEAVHDTKIRLQITGFGTQRLDRKVEATVYRVVQESLTNCAKYAQATNIDVTLVRQPHDVSAVIADNGRGFDVDQVMQSPQQPAFGLTNMRERALLINGSLLVRSHPGGGTIVTLKIPLKR